MGQSLLKSDRNVFRHMEPGQLLVAHCWSFSTTSGRAASTITTSPALLWYDYDMYDAALGKAGRQPLSLSRPLDH